LNFDEDESSFYEDSLSNIMEELAEHVHNGTITIRSEERKKMEVRVAEIEAWLY